MAKRGQITIFIILGIIIVAAILVFFLYVRPTYFSSGGKLNFDSCIQEVIEKSVTELSQRGGFIEPKFNYPYQDQSIPYLCYTNEYYQTCAIQKPFLKQHFEEQLIMYTNEKINDCYQDSISELRSRGYSVSGGKLKYNISIEPNMVRVEIQSLTSVDSKKFSKFNIIVNSPLYDTLMIATSLLQFETKYGDTDVDSYMLLYPDYLISKVKRGDGTTIYEIENKINNDKFKFASRSVVFPAGYV